MHPFELHFLYGACFSAREHSRRVLARTFSACLFTMMHTQALYTHSANELVYMERTDPWTLTANFTNLPSNSDICPTQHKIGHSGDVLPSQSLSLVLNLPSVTTYV